MILGIDISIYCRHIDNMLRFYTDELELFIFDTDFGMGNCRITSKENSHFALVISTQESHTPNDHPIFSINVNDIEILYKYYRNKDITSGGDLISKNGIFEYPAGRSITLRDPAGNTFIIQQNFY